MIPRRLSFPLAALTAMCLALPVAAQNPTSAQPPLPPADENVGPEAPTSAIKRISLSFSGGYFSGMTYFELPPIDDRAQLQTGTYTVALFNGQTLDLGIERPANALDAPIKKIDPGYAASGRIGFYLSKDFHFDLFASYARSKAKLSLLRFVDNEPTVRIEGDALGPVVEELYHDQNIHSIGGNTGFEDDFRSFTGGVSLVYDAEAIRIFGLVPQFGTGVGGVINRFTYLADKTALYFQLFGGLLWELGDTVRLDIRGTATTYSFATEEVDYADQVSSLVGTVGITWLFDVKPVR